MGTANGSGVMEHNRLSESVQAAFVVALGLGFFWDGLYAPGQQVLLTAVIALAVLIRRPACRLAGVEWAALALLFIGVAGSFVHPVAMGNATHGPLVAVGWVLALVLGRALGGSDRPLRAIVILWAIAASFMTFGGIALISYLPVHHSGRLAAFLGYPIAVGMLGLLGAVGSLPALAAGTRWVVLLSYGAMLAALLSGSRGVWVVAALLALYLVWARPGLLRRTGWPAAGALAAALWAGPAIAGRAAVPALVAAAVAGLAVLTVDRAAWLRIPAALAWLAALAFAPGWGWFLGRATAVALTEGSTVERFTFLRDGLALARHLPLGAGYRAWVALHLQGASYAYYSAEAHSALLDLTLAFGWAGGAAFIMLLGRFLLGLRAGRTWSSERLVFLAGLGALGLHAMLDWDLSYGIFAVLLWLGFGVAGASDGAAQDVRGRGVPLAVAALALAGAALVGGSDVFTQVGQRALEVGSLPTAARHATMAVGLNPYNDLGWAVLGQARAAAGDSGAALQALERARRLGPREPWYAELAATELVRLGRWRAAADAWTAYVRLWPWEAQAYETALTSLTDLTLRAELAGDQALAADLTEAGRAVLAVLDAQKAREPVGRPRRPLATDTPPLRQARTFFSARCPPLPGLCTP